MKQNTHILPFCTWTASILRRSVAAGYYRKKLEISSLHRPSQCLSFSIDMSCMDHGQLFIDYTFALKVSGKLTKFFSAELNDKLVQSINKTKRKTMIFNLELFAILCAVRCWKQCVSNSAVVIYMDNDAVRDCLISCRSPSSNSQPISDLYLKIEFEAPVNAWMSKIPTNSNIGDDLSRDECQLVTSLGCSTTDVDVDSVWNDMQEFYTKGGSKDQQCSSHHT